MTAPSFNAMLDALAEAPIGSAVEMDLPRLNVLAIDGHGHPGSDAFRQGVRDLWRVAYAVQQLPKTGDAPPGFTPFDMPPTEVDFESPDHDCDWRMFFPQPGFVTADVVAQVHDALQTSGKPVAGTVFLTTHEPRRVVQTTHVGFPDALPATAAIVRRYADEHGLTLTGRQHEVYVDDPIRVGFENARDLVRYEIVETPRRSG